MRDHHSLRSFELADNLVIATYQATKRFPKEELFGLVSQLRRAAVSIASNIVEGCARNSHAEYLRFLTIAFSSAKEVEYQLSIARRLGYLTQSLELQDPYEVQALSVETVKVLGGLVRSLSSRPSS